MSGAVNQTCWVARLSAGHAVQSKTESEIWRMRLIDHMAVLGGDTMVAVQDGKHLGVCAQWESQLSGLDVMNLYRQACRQLDQSPVSIDRLEAEAALQMHGPRRAVLELAMDGSLPPSDPGRVLDYKSGATHESTIVDTLVRKRDADRQLIGTVGGGTSVPTWRTSSVLLRTGHLVYGCIVLRISALDSTNCLSDSIAGLILGHQPYFYERLRLRRGLCFRASWQLKRCPTENVLVFTYAVEPALLQTFIDSFDACLQQITIDHDYEFVSMLRAWEDDLVHRPSCANVADAALAGRPWMLRKSSTEYLRAKVVLNQMRMELIDARREVAV